MQFLITNCIGIIIVHVLRIFYPVIFIHFMNIDAHDY